MVPYACSEWRGWLLDGPGGELAHDGAVQRAGVRFGLHVDESKGMEGILME